MTTDQLPDYDLSPLEDAAEEREYRLYAIQAGLEAHRALWLDGARQLPPADRTPLSDQRDLQEAALGVFVELGELVNATQWKSWRTYKEQTTDEREHMLEEWADITVFLSRLSMNLSVMYGVTPRDFAEAILLVNERNGARFRGEVPGREPPGRLIHRPPAVWQCPGCEKPRISAPANPVDEPRALCWECVGAPMPAGMWVHPDGYECVEPQRHGVAVCASVKELVDCLPTGLRDRQKETSA